MLALDWRILDILLLEDRLQSRISDLVAWTKTMLPVIRHSISEARKQLRTGHQDIRNYFSDAAAPDRTVNECSPPRQHRPIPQTVSALDQPPFASDLGKQEPRPLRPQPTLVSPDITTIISLLRERQINHEHDAHRHGRTDHFRSQYPFSPTGLSQSNSASKNSTKYDLNQHSAFLPGAQQSQLS
jgi:hypothetical protein